MERSRAERIQSLKDQPDISVLIIGAGINGTGTFRDLALQGVDVAIIDRGDYCSGASAASSHMIHGGIRYLENGEFRLVREAVRERNLLLQHAPHLVKPLPTTIPIYKWFSGLLNAPLKFLGLLDRPSERGAVVIKIGMTLYDFYSRGQRAVPKHVFMNRKESLSAFPDLNQEILFTATYYDGAMHSPERIAIELIQDAVEANPRAIPLNYVRFLSADGDVVTLRDEITDELLQLRPSIIVNASGPWIDLVNRPMGLQTNYIGGTKGSHLILDHGELRQAIRDHEFFFENKDGRIVLIFPLLDKVLIGTSDLSIDDPDDAEITEEEAGYFFEMIERVFPKLHVDQSHIIYAFTGVRPLQSSEAGVTGQISRDHKVQVNDPDGSLAIPVFSLVGGKWTSFRAFSELTADLVLERLDLVRSISTDEVPIGGGRDYPGDSREQEAYLDQLNELYQGNREQLNPLFDRHGTRIELILEQFRSEVFQPLETVPERSVGEIRYVVLCEDVCHLEDLFLRRTMLAKLGWITPGSLDEISKICGESLNWSDEKRRQEKDRLKSILQKNHWVSSPG